MWTDVAAICEEIRTKYSPCDVGRLFLVHIHTHSESLPIIIIPRSRTHFLVLNIPGGGHLAVAPISTIAFVSKSHKPGDSCELSVPESSNLPKDKHWTDVAPAGSVVLMQQPSDHIAGLLGDIVATRYKMRGVAGVFIDGHARDVAGVGALCHDGIFSSLDEKAHISRDFTPSQAVGCQCASLQVGLVNVEPGDVLVADESEQACCVIPQEELADIASLLPKLKKADDGILRDVQSGLSLKESFARWPDHYTNQR